MSNESTPAEYRLYQYTPSLPGALVAIAVFAVLTAAHLWKLKRYRTFYFTPFVIGGIFQVLGYAGRIWSHTDLNSIGGFVMQALLILLAPALYAASIYMILGRLLTTIGAESLSLIPPSKLTKIFVTGDVVSFSLQLVGGGLQAAGTVQLLTIGRNIIIAGLVVQITFFSLFVVVALMVQWRAARSSFSNADVPWKRHLWVLYITSTLILIRSAFRVVEYSQGDTGYLISHEIFLYMLDTVLMALVMIIFLIWYISDLQGARDHESKYSGRSELMSLDHSRWTEAQWPSK